jgi:hypothetical protein
MVVICRSSTPDQVEPPRDAGAGLPEVTRRFLPGLKAGVSTPR